MYYRKHCLWAIRRPDRPRCACSSPAQSRQATRPAPDKALQPPHDTCQRSLTLVFEASLLPMRLAMEPHGGGKKQLLQASTKMERGRTAARTMRRQVLAPVSGWEAKHVLRDSLSRKPILCGSIRMAACGPRRLFPQCLFHTQAMIHCRPWQEGGGVGLGLDG